MRVCMYVCISVYIYTETFIIADNAHTHPNICAPSYEKGNNPIQMMLNKLYQMWTDRKTSL